MTTSTKRLADNVYPVTYELNAQAQPINAYIELNVETGEVDTIKHNDTAWPSDAVHGKLFWFGLNPSVSNVGLDQIMEVCDDNFKALTLSTKIEWDGHNWSHMCVNKEDEKDWKDLIQDTYLTIEDLSEEHALDIAETDTVSGYISSYKGDEDLDKMAVNIIESMKNDGYYVDGFFCEELVAQWICESWIASDIPSQREHALEAGCTLEGPFYCEECGSDLDEDTLIKSNVCDACTSKLK
ncbi:hypothetical protein [Photobacterium iliopiscarium]|uniref:hypothetical protein n=1 Tax=Photobacterium iliopiscarium TaxID=56192 RepID=UPI001E29F774|nr:hypothetical protein [Photobacterium iliopiscarium]MCD9489135.1 hypothetical protein [Photobacterium iliopiscarium]MCF2245809.1 hypothetical protein [Photobacterium iliopiscarium]